MNNIDLHNPGWPCHCRRLKILYLAYLVPFQKFVRCISQPCIVSLKLWWIQDDTIHLCLDNRITPEGTIVLGSPLQKCTPKAMKSRVAMGLWWLSRLSAIKKVDISVVVFSLTFPLWTLTFFCPFCLVFLFFLIIRAGTLGAYAGAHRGAFRRGKR